MTYNPMRTCSSASLSATFRLYCILKEGRRKERVTLSKEPEQSTGVRSELETEKALGNHASHGEK